MGLSKKLARGVAGDVRARGRQYYTSGAVRILHGDTQSVRAEVDGTEVYRVFLRRRKKALQVCCSCPYFQDRGVPCKHVWATILMAEQRGLLQGPNDPGPHYLRECLDQEFLESVGAVGVGAADRALRHRDGRGRRGRGLRHRGHDRELRRPVPGREADRGVAWDQAVATATAPVPVPAEPPPLEPWPAGRDAFYVLDVPETMTGRGILVEVAHRQKRRDGTWTRPRSQRVPRAQIPHLADPADREILSLLAGATEEPVQNGYAAYPYVDPAYEAAPARCRLPGPAQELLLSRMCATGRAVLRRNAEDADPQPLHWDGGPPWDFWLKVARDGDGGQYAVTGELRRGDEHRALGDPLLMVPGGVVLWGDTAAPLQDFGAFDWVTLLRQQGGLTVPVAERDRLLGELLRLPRQPKLDLPPELRFEEVVAPPRPRLKIEAAPPATDTEDPERERLRGTLSFEYDSEVVLAEEAGRGVYQADRRRFVVRDRPAEGAFAERLLEVGFRGNPYLRNGGGLELPPRHLSRVVRTLLEEGWDVEAEGKTYRRPGALQLNVTSGIDWFELHGNVDFGDQSASLPDLLAALRKGEHLVRLGDGSLGLLPEEWLKKYGTVAALAKTEGDHLRFGRTQAGLLDAVMASSPGATCDATFARMREALHSFAGIEAVDPPAGFRGTLRGYQREGLGWMRFLEEFRFGGCLADDMGLGKTVQVLALLEERRRVRADAPDNDRPPPSLVVVPRSLVWNWKQEAERFTPGLQVLDHTGVGRTHSGEHFSEYDVVLTTYGTLRRDVRHLKDFKFDYCILDEAQAIKNAQSESAKAARQLKADHRLALSGTPVENHLGELWSLFEFLNPGMLGSAGVFSAAGGRNPDEPTRALLARALRPFILRRTKEQVAKDLPPKSEQTIHCEMEPPQRRLYEELRAHYRDSLLARVSREGLQRSRMHVLEALLRLRQAACHPGLIDKKREVEPSAKLDALQAQLEEVLDEGHKALVFSQFTKLLAIVRTRLDQEGIVYEYLDGRTRDRQAKVRRFQEDPDCKLFLISLKAGGLGLNLTAAEYVFLLDPWWNPAVEAQAMDRAHRIGQTRPVFAYRLITQGTVEEKILELQKTKRDLADAIVNADNSLIRNLSREDLELLLS
jgi:superfamily II DNA or RNA helicase